jgi:hypothetical protein
MQLQSWYQFDIWASLPHHVSANKHLLSCGSTVIELSNFTIPEVEIEKKPPKRWNEWWTYHIELRTAQKSNQAVALNPIATLVQQWASNLRHLKPFHNHVTTKIEKEKLISPWSRKTGWSYVFNSTNTKAKRWALGGQKTWQNSSRVGERINANGKAV